MVLMEAWMVCPVSSLALSFWLNESDNPDLENGATIFLPKNVANLSISCAKN